MQEENKNVEDNEKPKKILSLRDMTAGQISKDLDKKL